MLVSAISWLKLTIGPATNSAYLKVANNSITTARLDALFSGELVHFRTHLISCSNDHRLPPLWWQKKSDSEHSSLNEVIWALSFGSTIAFGAKYHRYIQYWCRLLRQISLYYPGGRVRSNSQSISWQNQKSFGLLGSTRRFPYFRFLQKSRQCKTFSGNASDKVSILVGKPE